jgi:ribose transport system substrate-binding protein
MAGAAIVAMVGSAFVSSTAGAQGSSTYTSKAGLAYAKAQVKKYSGAVTSPAVPAIASPANLKGKTIWYIPITNAVDSLAGMGTTMESALSHLGANVHVCDGGGLPTTVANCMATAAQQNAAAVLTSYIDYEMVPTAFQALAAKNIPVVVGNEAAPPGVKPSKDLQFMDGSAQTNLFSQLMAYLTIADSKGKANVIVIKLTDSASTTKAGNIEIALLKKLCPGCTVNSISMQTAAIAQMPSALSAALVANPSTDYVTVPTDAYLPPAMGGIEASGFASKVQVISADGGLAGLQSVDAGKVAYDPGNPVEYVGWQYANAVVRLLSGLTVSPAPAGPTLVFNAANVKTLDLTPPNYLNMSWYDVSDAAFQKPYLAAWKAN